jgi:hypothetical protein
VPVNGSAVSDAGRGEIEEQVEAIWVAGGPTNDTKQSVWSSKQGSSPSSSLS